MTKISSGLLDDTLNLIQLARETALARGNQEQAKRLAPVVSDLKNLVTTSRDTKPAAQGAPNGILAQGDFRTLLAAAQARSTTQTIPGTSAGERNGIIIAMSDGNMSDVEIARQMGMTREEVRLVVNLNQKGKTSTEGLK